MLPVFPGVFQEYRDVTCFFRSFPGVQGCYLFFQEFSKSTGMLPVFPGKCNLLVRVKTKRATRNPDYTWETDVHKGMQSLPL